MRRLSPPAPHLLASVLLVVGLLAGVLPLPHPADLPPAVVPHESPAQRVAERTPFVPNVLVAGPGQTYAHQVEPYVVVDSQDRVFVGWKEAQTADGPGRRVGFARSLDHGLTWTEPELMERRTPLQYQSDPWLAVDEMDRVYFARLDFGGSGSKVVVSRSDDHGETWGSPVDVHDQPNFADKEAMVSDGNGTLYLAYDDVATGAGNTSIRLARSEDGGLTWSPTSAVSPGHEGGLPVVAAWPNGTVAVAWWEFGTGDIRAATSWDRGTSWMGGVRVNPQPGSATELPGNPWGYPIPSLAIDTQGRLFLAWPEGEGADWDVVVSRSEDRGLTWSSPVRVNDDASGREQRMVSLSADGRGGLHAAWLDNRSGNLHVFYSNSTDGGQSWSPNLQVTTEATPSTFIRPGDYLGLASDDNGTAYVVWTDGRGEDLDIYFALGDFTPPTVDILAPALDAVVPSTTVNVSGVAEDNVGLALVEVSLNGTQWEPASGTSSWNATLTVPEGAVVLYARATDQTGNEAITTVEFTVVVPEAPAEFPLVLAFGVGGAAAAAAVLLWIFVRSRRKG